MKAFLRTRTGISCVAAFVLGMGWMFHRVLSRTDSPPSTTHAPDGVPPATATHEAGASDVPSRPSTPPSAVQPSASARPNPLSTSLSTSPLAESAAYLDQYLQVRHRSREEHDGQGNPMTRRMTASTPSETGVTTVEEDPAGAAALAAMRPSLRLRGRPKSPEASPANNGSLMAAGSDSRAEPPGPPLVAPVPTPPSISPAARAASSGADATRNRHGAVPRFNPYGRVIKCELVFTIDSTNEESPLIGLVMEPVYNNGQLILPAGAEFHGVARPDRLRDRLFSGENWVLVFPRERGRPNGRQLSVRGVALDRIEPTGSGVTWGITDGSYGLEGRIIRTLQGEEIKRFAATFFAEAALTLQERQGGRSGRQTVLNTPENAVLQGVSANLEKLATDISEEITRHGVFIRVPAGHQFYFYPKQRIEPDAADLPLDALP
jgi:hypothetical protein